MAFLAAALAATGALAQDAEAPVAVRDPFWPVGYTPPPPPPTPEEIAAREAAEAEKARAAAEAAAKAEAEKSAQAAKQEASKKQAQAKAEAAKPPPPPEKKPDWQAAVKRLRISGYAESAEGQRTCIIDGRVVSEGGEVSTTFDGFHYTWRVDKIARALKDMRLSRVSAAKAEP